METLRKPETIISVTSAVALIGSIVYFYRQMKSLREDLEDLNEKFKATINKIPDFSGFTDNIVQVSNAIKQLDHALQAQDEIILDIVDQVETTLIDNENLNAKLNAVIETMNLGENKVKLPEPINYSNKFTLDYVNGQQKRRPPQRGQVNRQQQQRSARSVSFRDEEPAQRGGRGNFRQAPQQSTYARQTRAQQPEYDDDEELETEIADVRNRRQSRLN
jgi:hypothetical protein